MASNELQSVSPVCSLCSKLYIDALKLSCLHSFCKKCLEKYIDKEGVNDKKLRCPTCNKPTHIPDAGIQGLPLDLRLSHLSELTGYQNKMKTNVPCERCRVANNVASKFCCKCCMFLCESCVKDHQLWRELKNHELISLNTYKKSNGKEKFKIEQPLPMCPDHNREELRFYCKKDETLVCRDCLVTTHRDHDRDDIEKVAEKERDQLNEVVPRIHDAITQLDEAIMLGKAMRKQVEGAQKEAAEKIDKMSEELIEAIQTRQKKLQQKCKEIAQGKDDVLANQIHQFEKFKETVSFLNEQIFDASNNHSAEELLSVNKTIKLQIEKVTHDFNMFLRDLQEDQSINTSLDISSLKDQISVLGYFPSVPEPDNCYVTGLSIPDAAIGCERKFKVILRDEKNQPLTGEAFFQYTITNKDIEDAPLPKVTITQSEAKDGTATLSITPDTTGEYELCVMVRNRPLNRFPFQMMVHPPCDYNNLLQANPTILNVESSQCGGIAVHPVSGKIYATNHNKNQVLVLSPDGTEIVQRIGSNDNAGGNLNTPWGIAIVDDVLYVASHNTRSIKKYDMNGEFKGEFGQQGNQLNGPTGVCSDGNGHILVADYNNKRIQMFTTSGDIVHSIACTNSPYDVAVDVDGNIHAAIYANSIIQVFVHDAKENKYKPPTQYSAGGNPTGITIDSNGYKLITDANNCRMRVIDPSGKEITYRGNCVYGVARDIHGAIYVAHNSNAQIQKFKTIK